MANYSCGNSNLGLIGGRYRLDKAASQKVKCMEGQIGQLDAQVGQPLHFLADNQMELHTSVLVSIDYHYGNVRCKTASGSLYEFSDVRYLKN